MRVRVVEVLHGFVLFAIAAISTTIATFQEGKATTAARHPTACAPDYAGNDRKEDQGDDNDRYYDGPSGSC